MPSDQQNFPLRLPVPLREQLEAVAQWNHRSLNSEIVVAIEAHVQREIQKREAK